MADKLSKRALQSPDKFQKEASGWLDWAHEHPREVAMGGAALLALIVLVGVIFGGGSKPGDSAAGRELGEALALVERPVVKGEAAEGDEKSFPSEQAKQEAIAKALTEVREKHAGSSTAVAAALPLADAKFKLGAFDDALALYDEYLQKAPANGELRFLALEGRALALESKGDRAAAIEAFDRMAKEAPAHEDRALVGKARLLEGQQKWDEARAAYEKVKKDHAEGAMARVAEERLASLNAAHPAPAAQAPAPTAEQ